MTSDTAIQLGTLAIAFGLVGLACHLFANLTDRFRARFQARHDAGDRDGEGDRTLTLHKDHIG